MILFSRKKKIQRDRNAGLVFHWRGGYAGNTGGLTLAIILATSIFALGMLGIKVYVNSATPPSRYRAEIIRVTHIDPSLRWHLERNSPHLNPWNSSQDELELIKVREKMYAAIDATRENQLQWNTVALAEPSLATPRIYEEGKVRIPSLARHHLANEGTEDPAVVKWSFILGATDKKVIPRLPELKEYPANVQSLENYQGKTLKFTVNVNAKGEVVSCLPLEWNADAEAKLIENWLNTLQFKALKGAKNVDEVETMIISVTLGERKETK